ncbi:MAG: YdiY family protein [Vicinamibacterales bacterium]
MRRFLTQARYAAFTALALAALTAPAAAQAPATPSGTPAPKPWAGAISAGINLTRGNTDTINYNLSFNAARSFSPRNTLKATGLYLRGTQNDLLTVSRTTLGVRNETTLSGRTFAFAKVDYLRDTFKAIDYLIAPGGGLGYKLVDGARTKYAIDAGLGTVSERNTGGNVRNDGALTAGGKLQHALSPTATLKHEATALWKAQDIDDALYTVTAGVAAALTPRVQLAFDVMSIYKNRPPAAAAKKNDVAVVTGLTMTF